MVKWLIHIKSLVAAVAVLVFHVSSIDCMTAQIEVVMKSLIRWHATEVQYNSIYTAVGRGWGSHSQRSYFELKISLVRFNLLIEIHP